MSDEEYLGDGLYASFSGGMIKLRAAGREHEVYLEPEVWDALKLFVGRIQAANVDSAWRVS